MHPTGRDPKHIQRMTMLRMQRKRKPNITDKHKAFLAELQAERNRLLEERAKVQARREAISAKFAAKQAEFRRAVNTGEFEGESEGKDAEGKHEQEEEYAPAAARPRRAAAKPAWAMSAAEAEAKEAEEEAEVLAFVEGLDLEGFLGEATEAATAAGVEARLADVQGQAAAAAAAAAAEEEEWEIQEVEVPVGEELGDPGEGWEWVPQHAYPEAPPGPAGGEGLPTPPPRTFRRRRRVVRAAAQAGLQAGGGPTGPHPPASLAESVLSHSSLASVHSKASAAALVARAVAERAAHAQGGLPA